MSTVLVFAELIFVSPVAIVRPTLNKVVNKINNAVWRYQQMNCSNERLNNVKFNFNVGFFFVLPFVMELLSSLLRIVLGILSVNIKMFQMTFWWTRSFTKRFGTWDNTKPQKICLSLKMFIIDYWRSFVPNIFRSECISVSLSGIVGNKAKRRTSKRLFQENKACQIFRKTNISYHLIRTELLYQFLECSWVLILYFQK